MAEDLVGSLRSRLSSADAVHASPGTVIHDLAALVNRFEEDTAGPEVQELVLRALEFRNSFGPWQVAFKGIARKQGLFPYIEQDDLALGDLIAYEFHRPINIDDVVFHRAQGEIYRYLLAGESVILSAPTSFGKSLIIDALIATNRYKNVVIVVPTIALMDETRRRLFSRFAEAYKVITHPSQERAARNIFVMTQERALELPDIGDTELFVIDEFYKLDPRMDVDRSLLLNQAFYKLNNTGAQFYLLGPNIRELPTDLVERLDCRFVMTDYATVVSEVTRVHAKKSNRLERVVGLCRELKQPTLVYCASPASARQVALALSASLDEKSSDLTSGAAEWAGDNYHPDWAFVRSLRHGVGLHHGRVPRALQQFVVRSFNDGELDFLVCTSTLIEGVNTKAKNVVVYDNKIAKKKFDYFTFNNIRGRSGRMFEHYVGHVYLFYDPPQQELPLVEVPVFADSAGLPDSLLIQMDSKDLSELGQERLSRYQQQSAVDLDVLKSNNGIDPNDQIRLAEHLSAATPETLKLVVWSGMPSFDELAEASRLIWDHLLGNAPIRSGVYSSKQLAFKINRFRTHAVRGLILEELARNQAADADETVEDALDFARSWATFQFPRVLMALDRIQRFVLTKRGVKCGDYSFYASLLENNMIPAGIAGLDEYGVPIQVGSKLRTMLHDAPTLDEALKELKGLDPRKAGLSPFEAGLVANAQLFI